MADPLLLIPGLLCDERLWAHQVAHLADLADPQVITLTQQDSVTAMAAQALLQAPPRFALAGLSMGGYVALEILRQAPERVDRLCLVDTQARADSPETRQRRLDLIQLAQSGRFKGVTPRLLPLIVHPDRLEEAGLVDPIMAMAERVGRDAFLRQQQAILDRIDSRPHLGAIACPTLVLCGAQDRLTPPDLSHEIAAGIPGAWITQIERCGHMAPLEQPEAVTALMRLWLAHG